MKKFYQMKLYKFILPQLILIVAILFNSCVKEPSSNSQDNPIPNKGIVVDSSVFFKVTFGGKTISVYKVYKDGFAIDATSFNSIVGTSTNSSGQTETNLMLWAYGKDINNYHKNLDSNIPWQTCDVNLITRKLGDAKGIYNSYVGGSITDLSIGVGRKEYQIEWLVDQPSTFKLEITAIDAKNIAGNFTCILIDGSSKIPAIGSFRLPLM